MPKLDLPTVSFIPQSVDEIPEIVKNAISNKTAILPIGSCTQLDLSEIDSDVDLVSTLALGNIVEYAPRDLVVVAQAGITIATLQAILRENGQTLPLEVAAPSKQTLGGIVASRATSLTRAANGSVRDWLIGCHVVNGLGETVVAGGKVVKNVAGYDLTKLYCGSHGTLGIITQVAFKLAPIPQASKVLLLTLSSERNSEDLLDSLAKSFTPSFTFLLNTKAARQILGENTPDAQFIALGFDGHADAIEALAIQASQIAEPFVFQTIDLPGAVASKFRSSLRDLTITEAPLKARCNILPSQVGAFARMLDWTANRAGLEASVFADAAVGTVWCHISPKSDDTLTTEEQIDAMNLRLMRLMPDFKDKTSRVGGSTVIETMPLCWRENGYAKWNPVTDESEWNSKIKAELDPHSVFGSKSAHSIS